MTKKIIEMPLEVRNALYEQTGGGEPYGLAVQAWEEENLPKLKLNDDIQRIIKAAEWCQKQFNIGFIFKPDDEMSPDYDGFVLDFTVCEFFPADDGSGWLSQTWGMDYGDRDTPPDQFEVPLVAEPKAPEQVVFETLKMLIDNEISNYLYNESEEDVYDNLPF